MILNFYLRFYTKYGQTLFISGNVPALGNNDVINAIPLKYLNDDYWHGQIELKKEDIDESPVQYKYILRDDHGYEVMEWGDDRMIEVENSAAKEISLIDTWNHAGHYENAFFTKPFTEVLLNYSLPAYKTKNPKTYTHEFRVKTPALKENEVVCLLGAGKGLGEWDTKNPLLLTKNDNWWTVRVNLSNEVFPVVYKYGVFNVKEKKFVKYENEKNRVIFGESGKGKLTVVHDGFVHLPSPDWKGAGVAIPVFSLRSKKSFGTGEFTDIKLLVDWAVHSGLKMIQLLPINDTMATHTWKDSYPYAAISAFALHPLYINVEKVAGTKNTEEIKKLNKAQKELNEKPDVDYEAVMQHKMTALKALYKVQKDAFKDDVGFFSFFDLNREWLVPYAVFCYLRDKYKTVDFSQWKTHSQYSESLVDKLIAPGSKEHDEIAFHYFVQYHLHLQLTDAVAYAHKHNVIMKGDLPIGIYRYSCDAWVNPSLYNMNEQAGAPPDDFAVKGQNWGFPTYNWTQMKIDGFSWWRRRFEQMSKYFDGFRIDHILGFFRIWSIPLHAVEGILGRFVPAIPVSLSELKDNGIAFDYDRYCQPYITDEILEEIFNGGADVVKATYLNKTGNVYSLKPAFDTQRKVEAYFSNKTDVANVKQGLYDLISNVLLIEEGNSKQYFHFRIGVEQTSSFQKLDIHTRQVLKELYIDYFYHRQDAMWQKQAMQKLPSLKRTTDMLVFGEDLGMVPHCVPDVMSQLGILSFEVQRMPKQTNILFLDPRTVPYMSVVTPSTHDMSTIRGWWKENKENTQYFYNHLLGHDGDAPVNCTADINKEIVLQHLYAPGMWAIFQLQDLLGINEKLRRKNPDDERINIPADVNHYWRYRMHLYLEDLLKEKTFNAEVKKYVEESKR